MKKAAFLIIFLVFAAIGCAKDEVKPSPDSLMSTKAFDSIYVIKAAYQNKDISTLKNRTSQEISESIINNLSFDKAELTFVPRIVRIKESTIVINLNWNGSWSITDDKKLDKRGIADLTLDKQSMKLIKIDGDNPFQIFRQKKIGTEPALPGPIEDKRSDNSDVETEEAEVASAGEQPDIEEKKTPDTESVELTDKPAEEKPVVSKTVETVVEKKSDDIKPVRGDEFFIQVGAWRNLEYAKEAVAKLSPHYKDVHIVMDKGFHKVRIAGIESKKKGMNLIKELKEKFGLNPILAKKTR